MSKLDIDNSDYNREWLTSVKLVHFLRVLFRKSATKVLDSVREFSDIDFEWLKCLGKKGVILDVDECIAPHHGEILPKNLKKIQDLLKENWKIVIFSNMKKSNRYQELESLGVSVITSKYAKPDRRWFQECIDNMNLSVDDVVMVGDNFLTDWGAISAGIAFIKVKPIQTQSAKKTISRSIQVTVRLLVDRVANIRGNI